MKNYKEIMLVVCIILLIGSVSAGHIFGIEGNCKKVWDGTLGCFAEIEIPNCGLLTQDDDCSPGFEPGSDTSLNPDYDVSNLDMCDYCPADHLVCILGPESFKCRSCEKQLNWFFDDPESPNYDGPTCSQVIEASYPNGQGGCVNIDYLDEMPYTMDYLQEGDDWCLWEWSEGELGGPYILDNTPYGVCIRCLEEQGYYWNGALHRCMDSGGCPQSICPSGFEGWMCHPSSNSKIHCKDIGGCSIVVGEMNCDALDGQDRYCSGGQCLICGSPNADGICYPGCVNDPDCNCEENDWCNHQCGREGDPDCYELNPPCGYGFCDGLINYQCWPDDPDRCTGYDGGVCCPQCIRSGDPDCTGVSYSYDRAGNMMSYFDFTQSIFHFYGYDILNRLINFKKGEDVENPEYEDSYVYDSSGNRVKKVTPDETTYYFYEGISVILENTIKECDGFCGETPIGECNEAGQYCGEGCSFGACPEPEKVCSPLSMRCESICEDDTLPGYCNADGYVCGNGRLKFSPVLDLPFDGSYNDKTCYSDLHTITPHGSSMQYISGKIGEALHLGLSDYIEVDGSEEFNLNQGTISFWAKADEVIIDQYQWIVAIGNNDLWIGFTPSQYPGPPPIFAKLMAHSSNENVNIYDNYIQAYTEDWHHFMLIADGTNLKLYVDESLKALAPLSEVQINDNKVRIGLSFSGAIDELKIYDKVVCSDGTLHGQCSGYSKACDGGEFVPASCLQCGCPAGATCGGKKNPICLYSVKKYGAAI
jgi:hypothetical protein